MPTPQKIAQAIHDSVEKFNKAIPKIQKELVEEITLLLKDLDIKNGSIKRNARNLTLINKIKSRIEKIVTGNEDYSGELKDFLASFRAITTLQNEYFSTVSDKYKPPKLTKALRSEAIDNAYESLTRAGISQGLGKPIKDILRANVTSGAKYTDLVKQVTNFMVSSKNGIGALERYAKQITTDTLNQYSAQYSDLVTNDLGLEWFEYTGALIESSRPFCEALHEKRYVHQSELPKVIKGDFPEFKGKINEKTGLPEGMIKGTNAQNFKIYRGGWNCQHQLVPVSELAVPKAVRESID